MTIPPITRKDLVPSVKPLKAIHETPARPDVRNTK